VVTEHQQIILFLDGCFCGDWVSYKSKT